MIQQLDLPNELINLIGEELDTHTLNSLIKTNHHFAAVLTPSLNKRAIRDLPGKLFEAATHGYENLTRLLLDSGADVDAKDQMGRTALSLAARRQHVASVKLLLERGADTDARDDRGNTALTYAVGPMAIIAFHDKERVEKLGQVIKLLLDNGGDINSPVIGGTPLFRAAATNPDALRFLLNLEAPRGGPDVNFRNTKGETVLHAAVSRTKSLKLLLEHGADIGAVDNQRRTVLHHFALSQYPIRSGQFLIDSGVDLFARDSRGETALHLAACSGKCQKIQFLLENGADANVLNDRGDTPLRTAVRFNCRRAISVFLDKRSCTDALENYSEETLAVAVDNSCSEIIQLLLEKGIDTSAQRKKYYGCVSLRRAAKGGSDHFVGLLLAAGINIRYVDRKGNTVLHHAVGHGHEAVVRVLLKNGAGTMLGLENADGKTAVDLAIANGYTSVAKVLANFDSLGVSELELSSTQE